MVYAVWAVRRAWAEANADSAQRLDWALKQSNTYCREHADAVAEYAARWEPLPTSFFVDYFDALRFSFDEPYREGLRRFFAEAHEIGELDEVPELAVLDRP